MLKEHTESITKSATDDQIKNIARELDDTTQKYHEAVTKYLKNRDDYNEAAQTRITNDANIKFGVVGVAFMCVFGSLALSLHPIFLVGCAIGGYTYRPVFRQSRKRIEITNDMEARLQMSKQCKGEIDALQKHIEYQLERLERTIK
ncbi:putative integral membrane protein [Babesia bovis T2Bo]|uniref:putative integral membrane protein n=1 Tax=Babesia bovis T2Bo TaxID=484906 RepID=UPI001C36D09E|nr:putative integral membrane protein [Babesia bovis T2Bo]KAG6439998.1 putative integral membrane protein [Babesia bovis T2Bo]